jgi:hypothetical protein
MAASLAMTGRIAEARLNCDLLLQADATYCISSFKDKTPFQRLEDIEKLAQALRIAGVPE